MALDERDFFNNRDETRTDKLACPRCKRTNEYRMRWVVRTRKDRIPPGADERDRALFAKLRDYMIRVDDAVTCKTCGKKFDIPSQHSMVFHPAGWRVASCLPFVRDECESPTTIRLFGASSMASWSSW
jgi:hypothetical protein